MLTFYFCINLYSSVQNTVTCLLYIYPQPLYSPQIWHKHIHLDSGMNRSDFGGQRSLRAVWRLVLITSSSPVHVSPPRRRLQSIDLPASASLRFANLLAISFLLLPINCCSWIGKKKEKRFSMRDVFSLHHPPPLIFFDSLWIMQAKRC